MAVGIASSVTTAILAVLAFTGAIVTYIASNYRGLTLFYIVVAGSAVVLVCAVWQGILGIAELANNGYQGKWKVTSENQRFDKQGAATLLGLALLGFAIVTGFTATREVAKPPQVSVTVSGALIDARLAEQDKRTHRVEVTLGRVASQVRRLERSR